MDPFTSIFNNRDIEVAKRRIKCDSILFLVCFFIPMTLILLIWNGELAFWLALIFSPYALTAIFGFFAIKDENSYANYYFTMLKCTFIYCATSTGISGIASLLMIYSLLTFHCDSSSNDACGLSKAMGIILFILIFLYFILSISAFTLWWFSNKHANNLKDLILRRVQNFQNPQFASAQFMPAYGIPIGRHLGYTPQYNQSY